MIRTTSVLNTSSSKVILINFRAHVQFHSDLSSSTRILDTFTRIVRLDFFTRKTIFHSDDYISTWMTIFPLGRHYLIQSASFRPDGNLFTRNIFTWTTISLGWSYFHSDDYISTWIIISSSGQQTFTRSVNFHSTVNFHSDGKLFTRISDWKHSPILICLSRPHMISDWDELYMKIDRLDETKLFHVEGFSIQGRIDGRITRATYQTSVWPSRHISVEVQSAVYCL